MTQRLHQGKSSKSLLDACHQVLRTLRRFPDFAVYAQPITEALPGLEAAMTSRDATKRGSQDFTVDVDFLEDDLYAQCKAIHELAGQFDRKATVSGVTAVRSRLFYPSGKLGEAARRGPKLLSFARLLSARLDELGNAHPLRAQLAPLQDAIAALVRNTAAADGADDNKKLARERELSAQQRLSDAYDNSYRLFVQRNSLQMANRVYRYKARKPKAQQDAPVPPVTPPPGSQPAQLDPRAILESLSMFFVQQQPLAASPAQNGAPQSQNANQDKNLIESPLPPALPPASPSSEQPPAVG